MSESNESHFRGYNAIREVIGWMQPLADWMQFNKPDVKEMTLKGPDFDLLKRWPKAASVLNVQQHDGQLRYRGFLLKRDKKAPRYPKREQ